MPLASRSVVVEEDEPCRDRADESVTEAATDEVSEEGADTFGELFDEDTEGDAAEVCVPAWSEICGGVSERKPVCSSPKVRVQPTVWNTFVGATNAKLLTAADSTTDMVLIQ